MQEAINSVLFILENPFLCIVSGMVILGSFRIAFSVSIFVIKKLINGYLSLYKIVKKLLETDYTVYENTKDYKMIKLLIKKGKV